MQFGQPVDGLGEQRRLVVLEPVVGRVLRGVLQPVGGGEVDDAADAPDELRRERHRRLVRQAEEDHVEPVDLIGVERLEHEPRIGAGQARIERRRGDTGL